MSTRETLASPSIDRRNAAMALALAGVGMAGAAQAQSALDDSHVVPEVLEMREKLRKAALAKDAAAIEPHYAPRFAHWRNSGKFQPRSTRIAEILSGQPLIETVPETQLVVQPFGPVTAVATGVTEIQLDGKPVEFSWLIVYVKLGVDWQVAMSTSNRLGRG
jgi:hypothetical protein